MTRINVLKPNSSLGFVLYIIWPQVCETVCITCIYLPNNLLHWHDIHMELAHLSLLQLVPSLIRKKGLSVTLMSGEVTWYSMYLAFQFIPKLCSGSRSGHLSSFTPILHGFRFVDRRITMAERVSVL